MRTNIYEHCRILDIVVLEYDNGFILAQNYAQFLLGQLLKYPFFFTLFKSIHGMI